MKRPAGIHSGAPQTGLDCDADFKVKFTLAKSTAGPSSFRERINFTERARLSCSGA
jgi:hypothetical protein